MPGASPRMTASFPRLTGPRRRPAPLLRCPPLRRTPRCRGPGPPLGCSLAALQALLQRIHQVDNVVWLLLARGGLQRFAGSLAAHQRLQRILVFVLELRGVEMGRLGIEDVA